MTIDVNYLLVTHSLQHRDNNNETTCPSHTSAVKTGSQSHQPHSKNNVVCMTNLQCGLTLLRTCTAEAESVTATMEL
jgi:hypothetical protein